MQSTHQATHRGPKRSPAASGHQQACIPRALRQRVAARAEPPSAHQAPSQEVDPSTPHLTADPEAPFRRYGKQFGAKYLLDKQPLSWLNQAPRVRVRTVEDRKLDELLDLAVLNARLCGMPGWEVRRRLEFLKTKRRNWEAIYHYITETDAAATLEAIEDANEKVEVLLSEEGQQRMSVDAMQRQLVSLQKEVDEAAEKLQVTQARVEQNLKRVNELKAEAAALERVRAAAATSAAPMQVVAPPAGTNTLQPASAAPRQMLAMRKKNRGLQSSLEMEPALRNFWFPAEFSQTLKPDMMVPFDLFGESWVMFRDENGKPACIKDTCAHRACPLSLGKVQNGQVVCAYHGWEFNGDGHCTKMPSTGFCRNVGVTALPCSEKDGFVWVWPGDAAPKGEPPGFTAPPAGFDIHAELVIEVPVEHGLLVENLLDLAHAPFTHQSTFARGWSVPDLVKFQADRMLSGSWDPYPINMSFQPPCCTISTIGLDQVGGRVNNKARTADDCPRHLHQLHVCLPAKRGHTRLLYRMSMDFMGWARFIPGIKEIWKKVAAQVMGEDLVLVVGQQDRMKMGEDTWANPMAYDKLAVRYRRWRNSVAEGNLAESQRLAATASMNAGQLFSEEEEAHMLNEQQSGQ